MGKILAFAGAAALLVVGVSASASADGAYHSERIALHAVDDAPLRSGSVVNIHANGPQVYASERYLLNGALPDHDYELALMVTPFDPTCASPAVEFLRVPLSTNAAGNAHGGSRFTPDQTAGLAGTHGVNWVVLDGDTAAYETGCTVVVLD
jgi:hypothetical protein